MTSLILIVMCNLRSNCGINLFDNIKVDFVLCILDASFPPRYARKVLRYTGRNAIVASIGYLVFWLNVSRNISPCSSSNGCHDFVHDCRWHDDILERVGLRCERVPVVHHFF